jgi:hypothetical protein
MTITLEAYFENGLFKIFAGGDSDSGISVKGATPEECAKKFSPYLEDYLVRAKKVYVLATLNEKVLNCKGSINLSYKNVMLYDGDTEKQEGEAFKVLNIGLDEDFNLVVEVDCDGSEVWDAEDLSIYELELLLKEIE